MASSEFRDDLVQLVNNPRGPVSSARFRAGLFHRSLMNDSSGSFAVMMVRMTNEVLGRYTPVEAVLMGAAVALAIVSVVWFTLGEAGHREGQWLLLPALVLFAIVVVLRRRRGAKK